jgi:hypothetical protein
MKNRKLFFLFGIVALFLTFGAAAALAGGASMAIMPGVGGGGQPNPGDLERFAAENFSSFEGDANFYTGEGDDMMDFGGPNRSFANETQTGRIFVINLNNALATNETVVLLPGYTWKPGDSGNNWLVDGAIKTEGQNSLVGTGSPKTIKEFLSFIMKCPTNIAAIRISSNNSTTQIEQQMTKRELSPFKDLESSIIDLGAYTNEQTYRDKMVTVPTPGLVAGPETYLDLPVIASSICTVTFFCGGVISQSSALRKKRDKAASTFSAVGLNNVRQLHAMRQANPTLMLKK